MIELMIDLQGGVKAPLYEKIYQHIKNEIITGKMKTGERLPSTRRLAEHLMVSRSTVEMAYEQLLAEGYIKAEPCRGFFVCDVTELYRIGMEETLREKDGRIIREEPVGQSHGGKKQEEAEIDFSPYAIDTSHFPFNIWRKINKNVLLDDKQELLFAGDGQGDYGLRKAIASYLHQARGVNCNPENMIIGAGNEYLEILLTQILGKEKKVVMENPTYLQAYHTFYNMGYEMELLPVDEFGLKVSEIQERDPDIVYVMPSHQFPLGTVMPLKQRLELLKWASEGEDRYLIEDDHDSEYRYRGKPIPSLQSVDHFGKVIYLGTFSKSIAPSLRISYMVLPEKLMERYRSACGFYSATVPKIQQEVLRMFMEEGHFERHLNKMRGVYRAKRDFLMAELKKKDWIWSIRGDYAGLHVLVEVKTSLAEEELCKRAAERNLKISGLFEHYIGNGERQKYPILLLGYGSLREIQILEGIQRLEQILKQ